MKSLGFLFALAAAVAVTSAQSQSYAGAQAGAQARAGATAGKGVTMISVPKGSVVIRKPGSGRPLQAKPAQGVAKARSAASAQAGTGNRGPNVGSAANAQAAAQSQGRPHHTGHHANAGQPAKLLPAIAQTAVAAASSVVPAVAQTAVTAASSAVAAVAKTPHQSPGDKDSKDSFPLFPLLDLGALALPLIGDIPKDFAKVIESGLTDNPLIKGASDAVTAFITAHSTTVPAIIAGFHKALIEAAKLISPENVEKAIATLVDKTQEVLKAIAAKVVEFVVSQADKIAGVIKYLSEAGQLIKFFTTGLSVIATLGLIFVEQVVPKIPIDIIAELLPIPVENWTVPLDKLPIDLEKLPWIPSEDLEKLPFSLGKLLLPKEKILEFLGHKPSSVSTGGQAAASQGQGGQAVATAESGAKAVAVASDGTVATAEASADAAADSEYSGESDESDVDATASGDSVAVATAG